MKLSRCLVGMSFVVLMMTMQAQAIIFENTSHEMASGDFFGDGQNEVAYIKADGSIFIHDFQQNTGKSFNLLLPPAQTAVKLVAADVNGDGRDDLAVVSSQALSLITLDVQNGTVIHGNAGANIQDITSANLDFDARDEVIVTNTSNGVFLFDNGFSALPGAGSALASGEFNGDATEEFLITGGNTPGNGTGLFFFDAETNAYTAFQGGGSGINRIAAGNLNPNDATDEVYLTANAPSDPFVSDGAGYVFTGGAGSDIGIGELAPLGGQERAYIIGGGGAIFQSSLAWGGGAFNAGYQFLLQDQTNDGSAVVGNNAGFTDFIVADIDNDGFDEIIGRKGGDELFIFQQGDAAFAVATPGLTVPEPTTAALGLLGIVGMMARRRRAA